jgi:hypothetical protein
MPMRIVGPRGGGVSFMTRLRQAVRAIGRLADAGA